MCQHVADINLVSIIMDGGDESNFVASDIKHREFLNLIGLGENLAQVREVREATPSHDRLQRAREDLVSGCLCANSFKRFRIMTCISVGGRYLKRFETTSVREIVLLRNPSPATRHGG